MITSETTPQWIVNAAISLCELVHGLGFVEAVTIIRLEYEKVTAPIAISDTVALERACINCGHEEEWLGSTSKTCQKPLVPKFPGIQTCGCKCVFTAAAKVAIGERDLRERVAALCHDQWAGWMRYLLDRTITVGYDCEEIQIQSADVKRWMRQIHTPYSELPNEEQESDRIEADKFLSLFRSTPTVAVDDYVAWCRYTYDERGYIQTINICDSDAIGAFKVYR